MPSGCPTELRAGGVSALFPSSSPGYGNPLARCHLCLTAWARAGIAQQRAPACSSTGFTSCCCLPSIRRSRAEHAAQRCFRSCPAPLRTALCRAPPELLLLLKQHIPGRATWAAPLFTLLQPFPRVRLGAASLASCLHRPRSDRHHAGPLPMPGGCLPSGIAPQQHRLGQSWVLPFLRLLCPPMRLWVQEAQSEVEFQLVVPRAKTTLGEFRSDP